MILVRTTLPEFSALRLVFALWAVVGLYQSVESIDRQALGVVCHGATSARDTIIEVATWAASDANISCKKAIQLNTHVKAGADDFPGKRRLRTRLLD